MSDRTNLQTVVIGLLMNMLAAIAVAGCSEAGLDERMDSGSDSEEARRRDGGRQRDTETGTGSAEDATDPVDATSADAIVIGEDAPSPVDSGAAADVVVPSDDWPNASNTGVPTGTTLRPSGSLRITVDGTVIDAMDITGSIYVDANDVTIRRSRIRRPGGQAISINRLRTGLLVEDCELDGTGNTDGSSALGDVNYTLRRLDIHGFGEGPRMNGNVTIEDCFVHDLDNFIAQGAHQDCLQSTGGDNITVRHNTLEMNVDGGNAAIMIGTYVGHHLLIENNLIAGGGWAVYGGCETVGTPGCWTDVRIVNNHFSRRFHANCGFYGPLVNVATAVRTGNVWHETGAPL